MPIPATARKLVKRFAPYALRTARLRRRAARLLMDWSLPLAQPVQGASWAEIRDRVQADERAPRVLMATTVTGHLAAVQFDALLAVALTLRGVRVEFLACDATLPACMADQHDWYDDRRRFLDARPKRDVCDTCWPVGQRFLAPLGLPVRKLSSLITDADRAEARQAVAQVDLASAKDWLFRGLRVGEHALAGALRFHARSDLEGVPHADRVLAQYLEAGAVAAIAAQALIARTDFRTLVAHHGIYIPQGIWVAAVRQANRQVVTWNPGYRTDSFVLSQGDTYHRTMIDEPTSLWEDDPLPDAERDRLLTYLCARRSGGADWISFGSGQTSEFSRHMMQLGLDPAKPTIGLLTSVVWDAQLHYDSNAFSHQMEWLDATITHVRKRQDVNLIIRIHPAELTGFIPSQQRAADHIRRVHGDLPGHIAVVAPENPINTYELMDGCDSVLIYSTKTGIELSAVGTPVIVAGEAWIRNKGFSIDVSDSAAYESVLAGLPLRKRLTVTQQERAERYAYHFFFRRMITLPGFRKHGGWPPYTTAIDNLASLAPGANVNLDMVCREIIDGGSFVAPS